MSMLKYAAIYLLGEPVQKEGGRPCLRRDIRIQRLGVSSAAEDTKMNGTT